MFGSTRARTGLRGGRVGEEVRARDVERRESDEEGGESVMGVQHKAIHHF